MAHERILIVDDNVLNAKLAAAVLLPAGFDVRTVTVARDALLVARSYNPHLILMDLQMPGMDGYELTRRLKADAQTETVIIVALTAYAMKGDDERAFAAGCDGYMSKPIDTRSFAAAVGRYLAAGPRKGR